jgi:hypothetical protein
MKVCEERMSSLDMEAASIVILILPEKTPIKYNQLVQFS